MKKLILALLCTVVTISASTQDGKLTVNADFLSPSTLNAAVGYEHPSAYGNTLEVFGGVSNHQRKPGFWEGYYWDGDVVYKHRLVRYKNGILRFRFGPQLGAAEREFLLGLEGGFEYNYVFRNGQEFSLTQKDNVNFIHGDTFRSGMLLEFEIPSQPSTKRNTGMAFEETWEQQQIYNYFRSCVYIFLIIEIVTNLPVTVDNRITQFLLDLLGHFKIFNSISGCKVTELVCICVVRTGTRAKKALKFNMKTVVIYPVLTGLIFVGLCLVFHGMDFGVGWMNFPASHILYAICSMVGTMLAHQGPNGTAKYYNYKVGEDRLNFENELFQQSEALVSNDYSVNIPMIHYWKRKMHRSWINIIDPFRETIVLGTPGPGKSFGVIGPSIRQYATRGFAMMCYDFKFPTLVKTLSYQFCKNRKAGKLPDNYGFHIVDFTDVEYPDRVNPIQWKYILDLTTASGMVATLLASLNKDGDEKRGGSKAFLTNPAENFLAAIIYFFANFHPIGFRNEKRLKRFVSLEGEKLELVIRNRSDFNAVSEEGNVVLNFVDKDGNDISIGEDHMFVELDDFSYKDWTGERIVIDRCWYRDEEGNEVESDTVTGEYLDVPYVLSFLGGPYDQVSNILMQDDRIASLMAPFKSAYENKIDDQLKDIVGTLRVNAARLASPEAYWVFTGDDLDSKISDREHLNYLVIANDPEKKQVTGSLNALVPNRLITRVDSRRNIPVSIIVDELPILYFHKIGRLIDMAHSSKMAATLGFQELPQLEVDRDRVGIQEIITTCSNTSMGVVCNRETLE